MLKIINSLNTFIQRIQLFNKFQKIYQINRSFALKIILINLSKVYFQSLIMIHVKKHLTV